MRMPALVVTLLALSIASSLFAQEKEKERRYLGAVNLNVPNISTDPSVKYDFPIIYVRMPRKQADGRAKWAEVGDPRSMEPNADLMLLQPDGKEEVLVPVTEKESIADPQVSFDAQWVYYAKLHDALGHKGSDIYKIHIATRKIVQLTQQEFTPNTGAADWSKTQLPSWGVYNLGPCPLPGGKLAFVSDRNVYKAVNPGYAPSALALQLFTMDDDGANVENIGHLNLGSALHPVALKDGRIMFSSLESQGLRSHHLWGVWSIRPDGTGWGPLWSAFEIGNGTANSTHFQTQLTDESLVVENYYNLNNFGFGAYYKFPVSPANGYAGFGPGYKPHAANAKLRHGRHADGRAIHISHPFTPYGTTALTPFILKGDEPSQPADYSDKESPRVGKFTHPSVAPDNHMLTVWSGGSLNSVTRFKPVFDSGIYLIKSGKPVDEPSEMLLIKNDPNYHEQWPRAVVPYKRMFGVDEPKQITPLANNGKQSKFLAEGSPFGLVGTSSLYKRESYPYGAVPEGKVTATFAEEKDPTGYKGHDSSHNWTVQGADAGLYENSDIHAIRIVLLEPTTENRKRSFYNHAKERMRILGEVPVRKFPKEGAEPKDPDGNPDTSFLVKVPANVAWTFQTLDKRGMVLNSAQTWHQVRPGEMRTDCGGCHAHSQQPTRFEETAAAKPDYKPFDLTTKTSLVTSVSLDESKMKWDEKQETGLRYQDGPKNVEYYRDIKPIFARSCVACHGKDVKEPAAGLVLDDETPIKVQQPSGLEFEITVPTSYARLAADRPGKLGEPKPWHRHGWPHLHASRYVMMMQARRSLLVWKVYGERLDGWQNDDLPHQTRPGDMGSFVHHGKPVEATSHVLETAHIALVGEQMPPPKAVKDGKVKGLSDEDKLTLVRWIDLGCPIDLEYDASKPNSPGGWLIDDQRPTLTLTYPAAGKNEKLDRILIGMHDYGSGLDAASLEVTSDVAINGTAAGENLGNQFTAKSDGVWELKLKQAPAKGTLNIAVKDKQGNVSRIERRFTVGK